MEERSPVGVKVDEGLVGVVEENTMMGAEVNVGSMPAEEVCVEWVAIVDTGLGETLGEREDAVFVEGGAEGGAEGGVLLGDEVGGGVLDGGVEGEAQLAGVG